MKSKCEKKGNVCVDETICVYEFDSKNQEVRSDWWMEVIIHGTSDV